MKRLLISLALVGTLLTALPGSSGGGPPPPLRVTFLSLDYGEATLVQAPGGMIGLIGAGSARDGNAVVRYLQRRRVSRVDVLVAATWSERSLGGVAALLRSVRVGRIVRNQLYVPTAIGERALQMAERQGIRVLTPTPGERIPVFRSPPCQMRAVAPTGPMLVRFAKDTRCSAIWEFEYDHVSVLCLGSTLRKHQQAMWDQADPRPWGHVLQIGDNGAADALLPSMLKGLKTRYVVIPIPRKSNARPAPALLNALERAGVRAFRTDRNGTVTFTTDGKRITTSASRG